MILVENALEENNAVVLRQNIPICLLLFSLFDVNFFVCFVLFLRDDF